MKYIAGFEDFWGHYPRRIGKLAALRAYEKALKHATQDTILAGVMLYKQTMPQEERFRPHPATWLNQGRWMDELPGVRQTQATDWYEECRAMHANECGLSRWRHEDRKAIDAMKATREI
jgi:hypothetical protein